MAPGPAMSRARTGMPQFLQAVTRFNAYPDANLVAEARASLAQQYHPGQAAARPPPAMPAAYSIVSNLGCLLFLERSEPQAAEELTAAVRHLREAIGGGGLEIECTSRGLRLNRVPIPAGCPGAVEVTEQFLHQGLTAIRFPTIDVVEAEAEALTESESEGYRRMLSLLTSQRHLAMLARLATEGEQKQEALVALRRLGPPATRVLMDLLAEAMTLGERRGY